MWRQEEKSMKKAMKFGGETYLISLSIVIFIFLFEYCSSSY